MSNDPQQPRVLIVDDVPANVAVLGTMLSREYDVQFANSGKKAIQLAAEERPDVILLDIMMPEMDGYETCRRLKSLPGLADIPVIFVTALAEQKAESRGLDLGAVDYLTKPVNAEIARLRIRNLLEREVLRKESSRLAHFSQTLLESAGEGILGVDEHGECNFINPAACNFLGQDAEDVLGKPVHSVFFWRTSDGGARAPESNPLLQTLADGECRRQDDWFVHRQGQLFPVHLCSTALKNPDGRIGALLIFSDRSENQALEERLTQLATHDPLTGVANRRLLLEKIEGEIARLGRCADPVAMLMIDLDRFKAINDRYGHAAGDAVLVHFARVVGEKLRKVDILGRLGGEEFCVLLPGTGLDGGAAMADRLRRHLEFAAAEMSGVAIPFTVSIGVTVLQAAGDTVEKALDRADKAMYLAKAGGRNRVEVFSEFVEPAVAPTSGD